MRRKQLLILLFLELVINSVVAQGQFSISGTVPSDLNGAEISLSSDNPVFKAVTAKVKNRSFSLSNEIIDNYEHVYLSITKNGEHVDGWDFFIARGLARVDILSKSSVSDQHDISFYKIPFIEEQNKYRSMLKKLDDSIRYADYILRDVRKKILKQYDEDSVTTSLRSLKDQRLTRKIDFIKSIQDSYLGLYLFNKDILTSVAGMYLSPDSLKAIYSGFNTSLQQTNLGRAAQEYIIKKKSLVINEAMPDFIFSTNDNQRYQLSSFRNKSYVLICFWDSWCRPCVESIPLLKKLNKDYGKELQMISVSIDKDTEKWKSSLKKYAMPWLQTCDINSYIPDQSATSLYDIKYIPQYFLIDKAGKLIYHNTQLMDDDGHSILQKMLKELIN